ncbi:MAG: hypothetical protein U9N61_13150, partial [Euryarchaeota archaeon]|nr:hypothetical protein [Euryarchaeota archaeon]
MYQDDGVGGRTLHPGIALLQKLNKSKDKGKAIADLDPKDRALYDQGREIVGRMMSLETPAAPDAQRQPGIGDRASDRGSSLSSFANPMDGMTRTGEFSANKARRLAGERRATYLQSMQSQRDEYANR